MHLSSNSRYIDKRLINCPCLSSFFFCFFFSFFFQIPVDDSTEVQDGDMIGFLSEVTQSGICFDFEPMTHGTSVVFRSFDYDTEGLPKVGKNYKFTDVIFSAWRFAISVSILTGE